jgi:hypothetical protein
LGGDYIYRWATKVMRPGRGDVSFANSTLHSFPLTPARLARLDEQHTPTRTLEGEALAYLLEHADGDHKTYDLGVALHNRFPSMFRSTADAVRFATEHALRYCR